MNSISDLPPVGIMLDPHADLTLLMSLMVDVTHALQALGDVDCPNAIRLLQGVLLALGRAFEERNTEVEEYLAALSKMR